MKLNADLQLYAQTYLKENMPKLSEKAQRMFKLMYARDNGHRSVDDALVMEIPDVIDEMNSQQLNTAMRQVKNSLEAIRE